MSNKEFINNLSSTYADVRKLNVKVVDAKKIKLNGTNIENLLSSAGSNIIIEDGREVKTQYDIWEHAAVENADGSITVKNLYIPDASGWIDDFGDEFGFNSFNGHIINVRDNKMYKTDTTSNVEEFICNIDTSKLVNADYLPLGNGEFALQLAGDIFCSNFIGDLNCLRSGKMCFANDSMGYDAFELNFISNLPSLMDGTDMFYQCIFNTFASDENGSKVNLDSLEIGDSMFCATGSVKKIHDSICGLPKLRSAVSMFSDCSLFNEKWTLPLPSLEDGSYMFMYCRYFEFYSDLPKLKNGYYMLHGCEKFRGSLPSLENGYCMFGDDWGSGVGLDSESLLCIVNTLPSRVGLTNTDGEDGQGYITITLACDDTDESRDAFVQEVGWDNWQEMYDELTHATEGKNWTAQFSFAGSPSASYSLRNPKPISKVWAKVEEIIVPTDEEIREARKNRIILRKPHWTHTSADGKHFILHAHHMSNDNTGYTQFDSLEAAEEHYGLIRKEESAN